MTSRASNETPQTLFTLLKVPTFPIYGRENVFHLTMLCEEYTWNGAKPFWGLLTLSCTLTKSQNIPTGVNAFICTFAPGGIYTPVSILCPRGYICAYKRAIVTTSLACVYRVWKHKQRLFQIHSAVIIRTSNINSTFASISSSSS
jgi:hypothetical protein